MFALDLVFICIFALVTILYLKKNHTILQYKYNLINQLFKKNNYTVYGTK